VSYLIRAICATLAGFYLDLVEAEINRGQPTEDSGELTPALEPWASPLAAEGGRDGRIRGGIGIGSAPINRPSGRLSPCGARGKNGVLTAIHLAVRCVSPFSSCYAAFAAGVAMDTARSPNFPRYPLIRRYIASREFGSDSQLDFDWDKMMESRPLSRS